MVVDLLLCDLDLALQNQRAKQQFKESSRDHQKTKTKYLVNTSQRKCSSHLLRTSSYLSLKKINRKCSLMES
jgi:hypothetical protein